MFGTAVITYVRLVWKWQRVTNLLAYYNKEIIIATKWFVEQAPSVHLIKIIFLDTDSWEKARAFSIYTFFEVILIFVGLGRCLHVVWVKLNSSTWIGWGLLECNKQAWNIGNGKHSSLFGYTVSDEENVYKNC